LIHPSALAPAAALLLVAFWRIKLSRRLILQALLALTILLSGVFVQVARNGLAGDGTGFTVTAFSNAQLGMWGTNNPTESEKCSQIGRLTTNLNKGGMRWDSPVLNFVCTK
jgi:small-conductance mechanosensitive channel